MNEFGNQSGADMQYGQQMPQNMNYGQAAQDFGGQATQYGQQQMQDMQVAGNQFMQQAQDYGQQMMQQVSQQPMQAQMPQQQMVQPQMPQQQMPQQQMAQPQQVEINQATGLPVNRPVSAGNQYAKSGQSGQYGMSVPANSGVANSAYYGQASTGDNGGMAIAALICAFLVPLVGLILGIVGLNKAKSTGMTQHNGKFIASIIIGGVSMALSILMVVLAFTLTGGIFSWLKDIISGAL